jgi:hypothetical protein
MGLFDIFKRSAAIASAASSSPTTPQAIASPLSASQMQTIVWSDVFGGQPEIMTRAEALAIPGVFKARAILLALLADKPLEAGELDAAGEFVRLDDQPEWLRRTSGPVSPWHRMAATLDDIIFYGWSLWVRKNDADGRLLEAERVPIDRWKFSEDGLRRVLVDRTGNEAFAGVDESEVILIPGPSEGLLPYASRVLAGAVALDEAWVERARNPVALTELHQTIESNLSSTEARELVAEWNKARQAGGGAAFTPYDVEVRDHGQAAADLYVEGRNAGRIDIANFFNLPGSLLDATTATASLTYSTQEGDANEVALYTLPYWSAPITGRLSQDDVSGEGVLIRQHLGSLVTPATSPIGDPGNE